MPYKLRTKRVLILTEFVLLFFIIQWVTESSFPQFNVWELPVFSYCAKEIEEHKAVFSLGILLVGLVLLIKELLHK